MPHPGRLAAFTGIVTRAVPLVKRDRLRMLSERGESSHLRTSSANLFISAFLLKVGLYFYAVLCIQYKSFPLRRSSCRSPALRTDGRMARAGISHRTHNNHRTYLRNVLVCDVGQLRDAYAVARRAGTCELCRAQRTAAEARPRTVPARHRNNYQCQSLPIQRLLVEKSTASFVGPGAWVRLVLYFPVVYLVFASLLATISPARLLIPAVLLFLAALALPPKRQLSRSAPARPSEALDAAR